MIADRRVDDTSADVHGVATVTAVTKSWGGTTGPTVAVRYAFTAADGTARTGTLGVARPSARYTVGATIDITYPVGHPEQSHVSGEIRDATSVPWFVPFLFGLGALVIGVAALSRMRWIRATLRDNPWVLAEVAVIQRPIRLLQLRGAPDDGNLLAEPLSWRARTLDEFAPTAWVAGTDRRFLVAPPGGAPVLRCRRIRLLDDPLSVFDATPLHSRIGDSEQ
ncbi:MAG: hypothetical protein JWM34_2395 [Ilumatobacteraceae bacterium]|nr:hypothetical protein [Ilumatobacteraceae bacterium]